MNIHFQHHIKINLQNLKIVLLFHESSEYILRGYYQCNHDFFSSELLIIHISISYAQSGLC